MRKIFKSLLLLLPLLLLSACYEVEGYITNDNGEPVKDVGINLKQVDENGTEHGYVGDNVHTDAKGYYNISFSTDYPAVNIITYHSVGDDSNPQVSTTKLDLNDSSQYRVDIRIKESSPTTIEYKLTGLITDESGAPIKSASVTINEYFAVSDENGSYSLPLLQNEQTVHVSKEGYTQLSKNINYTDAKAHTLNFQLEKAQ